MFKVIMKFVVSVVVYISLLPLAYVAAFIVPLFTKADDHDKEGGYKWGGIFGTYDNPPQGDEGWVNKRSPFPNVVTGWRGYINRVGWMIRNKLYGLKKRQSVPYKSDTSVIITGNPNISDKEKVAGWMFAKAYEGKKLVAFEWYSITPYSERRNVRIRMGWKIKGRKFTEMGHFAPLVFTFNPVDGYGDTK